MNNKNKTERKLDVLHNSNIGSVILWWGINFLSGVAIILICNVLPSCFQIESILVAKLLHISRILIFPLHCNTVQT